MMILVEYISQKRLQFQYQLMTLMPCATTSYQILILKKRKIFDMMKIQCEMRDCIDLNTMYCIMLAMLFHISASMHTIQVTHINTRLEFHLYTIVYFTGNNLNSIAFYELIRWIVTNT